MKKILIGLTLLASLVSTLSFAKSSTKSICTGVCLASPDHGPDRFTTVLGVGATAELAIKDAKSKCTNHSRFSLGAKIAIDIETYEKSIISFPVLEQLNTNDDNKEKSCITL